MPTFFCETCQILAEFQSVQETIAKVNISRSTLYFWMDRGWVHWLVLPNNRRLICLESLARQGRKDKSFVNILSKSVRKCPKMPKTVRKCPIEVLDKLSNKYTLRIADRSQK